jgi:hypothetical protein
MNTPKIAVEKFQHKLTWSSCQNFKLSVPHEDKDKAGS